MILFTARQSSSKENLAAVRKADRKKRLREICHFYPICISPPPISASPGNQSQPGSQEHVGIAWMEVAIASPWGTQWMGTQHPCWNLELKEFSC